MFAADHVCGLRRYNNAKFVYTETAYKHFLKAGQGFRGPTHAFFPGLLPADFEDRSEMISVADSMEDVDFFKDGSIVVVPLPGHCLGHVGVKVTLPDSAAAVTVPTSSQPGQTGQMIAIQPKTRVFFAGDACWNRRNLDGDGPHWLTFVVVHHSKSDYLSSMEKISGLKQEGYAILPSHCRQSYSLLQ